MLYILRRPEVGFVLLALLAPISNYLRIGSIKLVYIIGACLLAGTLYWHIRQKGARFPKFAVAYAMIFLSGITYAWIRGGFSEFQTVVGLTGSVLIVCAVFLLYREVGRIERWLWVFALSVAISNIVIVGILLTYPALRPVLFDISSEGVRLRGTLGNPNTFGGAQLLAFSIFAYFVFKKGRGYRVMSGIGGVVVFLALMATQSRSAIFGLFFGVAIVGFFAVRASRRPLTTTAVICFSGIFMVTAFLSLPDEIAGYRLARVGNTEEVSVYEAGVNDIVEGRFFLYRAALRTIWENPSGVGFIEHEALTEVIARNSIRGTSKIPHNFVLSYLVKYGVVWGSIMSVVWFAPLASALKKFWKRKVPLNSISCFMLIGVTAYLVHNLLHSITNWVYFWTFWGIFVNTIQLEDRTRTRK